MRIILLFCMVLTCFGKVNSQSRFSITPTLENSYQRTKIPDYERYSTNPYYTVKKRAFTKPFRFSPLTIGILLNYRLRNNWKISFGISQADAMLGYGIYYQGVNTFKGSVDTTVSANSIRVNHIGVAMTKFPLLLSKTIYNTDSIQLFFKNPVLGFSLELFAGVSYLRKPRGTNPYGSDLLISDGQDSILIYPSHYLSYESNLYSYKGNNLAYSIGVNLTLKTAKKKELFSFRSYYTYSHRVHAQEVIKVTVNNSNFIHVLGATGTGIYIQLSRNFNIPKKKANSSAFLKQ